MTTQPTLQTPAMLTMLSIVALALLAPLVAPFDPNAQLNVVALKNSAPSFAHLLGTDSYSRDIFSRLLYGARSTITVSLVAVVIATSLGTVWGSIAAFAGGVAGEIMMGAVDVVRSVPRMLILLAAAVMVGPLPAGQLGILLGFTAWASTARLVFTLTRSCKALPFVEGARAIGGSRSRVAGAHVFPQLTGALAASSALLVADLIALEAALSFIGLGVQPPTASWGNMIQDALPYLGSAWWVAAAPCALVIITVLSASHSMDSMGKAGQGKERASVGASSIIARWRTSHPAVHFTPADRPLSGYEASPSNR